MNIGLKIKELRVEKNLNQRELAKKIGVSQPTVVSWELGQNEPKATYVIRLAKFFDVSADFLLDIEDIYGNKI